MEEKISKNDVNAKVQDLQLLEQSLQSLMLQKQNFQLESLDIENALDELKDSSQAVYKIVGPAMFLSSKAVLDKDLKNKKAIFDIRIKSIEKQEHETKEKLLKLREEIMSAMEKTRKS